MAPPDDWGKWQEVVLYRLDELQRGQDNTHKEVTDTKIAVAKLQVKSSVWGAIGGFLSATAVSLIAIFR